MTLRSGRRSTTKYLFFYFYQSADCQVKQEGFFSWLSGNKGTTSSYTTPMSEFPWLSFFVMEAEEERPDFLLFWQALIREVSENHQQLSLDKCHKKIVAEGNFPEHAINLNSLPVRYIKWGQSMMLLLG